LSDDLNRRLDRRMPDAELREKLSEGPAKPTFTKQAYIRGMGPPPSRLGNRIRRRLGWRMHCVTCNTKFHGDQCPNCEEPAYV
jgi:hypothetical protein